jgi:hypothetical protein
LIVLNRELLLDEDQLSFHDHICLYLHR